MAATESVCRSEHKRKTKPTDDCDDRDPFSRQITIDEILALLDTTK